MTMRRLEPNELKVFAQKYNLVPCKIKGTTMINIRKSTTRSDRFEDISWTEFDALLVDKGLAVYLAGNDFIKILRNKG